MGAILAIYLLVNFEKVNKLFFKNLIVSMAVLLIFELFIFNFASYANISGKYNVAELDLTKAQITGFKEKSDGGLILYNNTSGQISFSNINKEIETIYIDIDIGDLPSYSTTFSFVESTDSSPRSNGQINFISDNEHTKYALCSFAGDVSSLKFNFSEAYSTIQIKSITVNKQIPLDISFMRYAILFAIINLISALCTLNIFKKEVGKDKTYKRITALIIAAFALAALFEASFASCGIAEDFKNPVKNQINAELVDAFEAGQVNLLTEPSDELLALENPYNWGDRLKGDVSAKWDHCLYDGEYYSYYGIAPVILLFLPYHLLTGMYFPSVWAIFLFGVLGIIFLGMTYYVFTKKFFPAVSNKVAVCGLIICEIISGIWFCFSLPNFYEIAQSSGFACITIGAYFLLASNVVGDGKISKLKIALSSVFLSLAVMCRPTLAVYCLCALIFIFMGLKKASGKIKYLLTALLPFVIIGSAQMLYNYLRFDSLFDFGIQYSLTINDFTGTTYHLPLAVIGFYNFIFALPKPSLAFPFLDCNYSTLDVNGYYFTANTYAVGMFARALPMLAYAFARKAYSYTKKNKGAALLIFASCVLAPFIIIFSIWESGYGVRYCVDFSWQMLFGALATTFIIYIKCENKAVQKIIDLFFVLSVAAAIWVNFAQIYPLVFNGVSVSLKAGFMSFARLFEFWNLM